MPAQRTLPPPRPLAETEPAAEAALQFLLKMVLTHERAGSGQAKELAKKRGQAARQAYDDAMGELRRSERARGRAGSVNYIGAKLGQQRHSSAVYAGSASAEQMREALDEALRDLEKATW